MSNRFTGKKCIVTGGAGFIGAHLAVQLLAEGASVTVIDNLSAGHKDRVPADASFVEADIQDEYTLKPLFAGVDYVFHAAAIPGVPISIEDPAYTHRVNVDGAFTVFEAARQAGVARIIFSSSAAVYGAQSASILTETMEPRPLSPYGFHKLAGEQMLRTWSGVYGIETVSLRYFNVYGSGMDPNGPYAAVVGKFLDMKKNGKLLVITGDGEQTRDFVHVADIVEANIRAALSEKVGKGEAVNIGTGVGTSVNTIAELVGGEKEYVEARQEVKDAVADITRARELLSYEPQTKLAEGINDLLA